MFLHSNLQQRPSSTYLEGLCLMQKIKRLRQKRIPKVFRMRTARNGFV